MEAENGIHLFSVAHDPLTGRINYASTVPLPIVLQLVLELMVSERVELAMRTKGSEGGKECKEESSTS